MSDRANRVQRKLHRSQRNGNRSDKGGYYRRMRAARAQARVLVYSDKTGHAAHLANGLSRLGMRAVVVRTPLEAIVTLQDESDPVQMAFVPLDSSNFNMAVFCAFLRDNHPRVRRMAFVTMSTQLDAAVFACSRQCDRVLCLPRKLDTIEYVLEAAL